MLGKIMLKRATEYVLKKVKTALVGDSEIEIQEELEDLRRRVEKLERSNAKKRGLLS